jgi:hypothetical protein
MSIVSVETVSNEKMDQVRVALRSRVIREGEKSGDAVNITLAAESD